MTQSPDLIPAAPPEEPWWCKVPPRTAGAVLVLLTLLAYLPVMLYGGFIWDDPEYVVKNPLISDRWSDLWKIWVPVNTPQYYPLVFSSFWIEHNLWGVSADGSHLATGYHVTNVLLHALNGLLVWQLFLRIGVRWAWLIGAIFALHPLHVESAAWVAERKNVLSGFFYLLSALAYLRFDASHDSPSPSGRHPWRWYAVAAACFVLALLSKTVTSSLPAALVLVMVYQRKQITVRRIIPLLPLLAVGISMGLFTAWIEKNLVGYEALASEVHAPWLNRILVSCHSLWFYALKLLLPSPLIFNYPRWDIQPSAPGSWVPFLLFVLLAGGLLYGLRRGWRGPFVALSFYAGSIFPAVGIVFVYPHIFSFVADHFCYLASLGIIALVVAGLARVVTSPWGPLVVSGTVLASCGILTCLQTTDYQNEEHLWRVTQARNPRSWMACNNLGAMYLQEAETVLRLDRVPMARVWLQLSEEHTGRALALKSVHHKANLSRARALHLLGRHAESIPLFETGLKLLQDGYHSNPEKISLFPLVMFHDSMGQSYLALNRLIEAEENYRLALEEDPFHYPAILHQAELFLHTARPGLAEEKLHYLVERLPPPGVEMVPDGVRPMALTVRQRMIVEAFAAAQKAIQSHLPGTPGLLQTARLRLALFYLLPPRADFRDLYQTRKLVSAVTIDTRGEIPEVIGAAGLMLAESGKLLDAIAAADSAVKIATRQKSPSVSMLQTHLQSLHEQHQSRSEPAP